MPPMKRSFPLLVALCVVLASAGIAPAQLHLRVVNHNRSYCDTNVFFRFGGSPPSYEGTINGQPILKGTNYTIADIGSGIAITSCTPSAKIFVSLGRPFGSGDAGNNFNPNFANPSLPDFSNRWDKIELSYLTTDPNSCANLTADDFAGVPMRISTTNGAMAWHFHDTMNSLLGRLAALTSNSPIAVVTSQVGFVRVINPHTAANAPWPSLAPYLHHVREHSITTRVEGLYNGIGGTGPWQAQRYYFHGYIDAQTNLVLVGSGTVVGAKTLMIHNTNLEQYVWDANPWYYVNGSRTNNSNCVYDCVMRDILAGLNLGLVGTTRIDPRTAVPFTNETTEFWYNYNGVAGSSLHYTNVFGALWDPGTHYYNQYAAILATNTDAYSFPFNDTLAKPLLPLGWSPCTMTLEILPDDLGAYISGMSISNGLVTLTVASFFPNNSNDLDRTSAPGLTSGWQNVASFVAATTASNHTEALTGTATVFRVRYFRP